MISTSSPETLVREEIRALHAYHVPPPQDWVKLDAMENPYSWPASLEAPLAAALAAAAVNRYPDAEASSLKHAIRRAMKVPDALDIVLGNGSDEIIQIIALALAKPGATVLSVEPAFVMFRMIATFAGMRHVGVPLKADDFALDESAMMAAIDAHQPALTFIAYPNNPTGNLFDRDAIRRIIAAAPGLVVVDEAYFAFSRDSFLDEIAAFPNAVLMRTVSKLGLAGLRLGMLMGAPAWLNEFEKLRLPYNINCFTQAAATLALNHIDAFHAQTESLIRERTRMFAALDALLKPIPGALVWPSEANFLLIRVAHAAELFEALKARRILVKHTGATHPLLQSTLRITIGTPAENKLVLAALAELLKA